MRYLLKNASAVSVGDPIENSGANRTFQAVVSGTGAVNATVDIEVSNNRTDWLNMGTITLSGTSRATDGFAAAAPWAFIRARVSAISGSAARVDALVGV